MRVMIVEDNCGDQRILQETFKRVCPDGQSVVAEDADMALEMLEASKTSNSGEIPTVILLDLNLPKKNGKEFLRDLKADELFRQIPVLVLTSSDADCDISDCYASGASCYMKKPSRFQDYIDMMRSLCEFWFKQVLFPSAVRG